MTNTPLPDWVAPATEAVSSTSVGVSKDGDLYLYGKTHAEPGPTVPAVRGYLVDIDVRQHAASGPEGARNYLELTLATAIPGEQFVLRVPCKPNLDKKSQQLRTPWTVRTLLGALDTVSLSEMDDRAIKLQTKRGERGYRPTFFQVYPYDTAGNELAEVRAEPIGFGEDELLEAVNRIRAGLGRAPLPRLPIAAVHA